MAEPDNLIDRVEAATDLARDALADGNKPAAIAALVLATQLLERPRKTREIPCPDDIT